MRKVLLIALILGGLSTNVFARSLNFNLFLLDNTFGDKIDAGKLRIGDAAPPIKARWVKGTPVAQYKRGTVYVLEFWATWCGPCKKAMPHISELARKQAGKAVIIGVNVWERPQVGKNLDQTVDDFVKESGYKMDYNVCMDGTDGYMAKNYVQAAAQPGIPATMIVDKNGNIAWIGHPESMDGPLQKIIDGTFDVAAFKLKMDAIQQTAFEEQKQSQDLSDAIKPVVDAVMAKDYPLVLSSYENLMANHKKIVTGEYYKYVTRQYYSAMLNVNPNKAYADALKFKDSTINASIITTAFAMHEGLDKKFYQYSLDFFAKQKEEPFDLPTMAAANFNIGNAAKAVELQEKWIAATQKFSSRPDAKSVIAADNLLKKYRAALK